METRCDEKDSASHSKRFQHPAEIDDTPYHMGCVVLLSGMQKHHLQIPIQSKSDKPSPLNTDMMCIYGHQIRKHIRQYRNHNHRQS